MAKLGVKITTWQPHVRKFVLYVQQNYPEVTEIWTRPGHQPVESLAVDFMCSKSVGDRIAAEFDTELQAREWGIDYIIWYRKIWSLRRIAEGWRAYFDGQSKDPYRAHTNHVHVSFVAEAPKVVTMYAARTVKGYGRKNGKSWVKYTRPVGRKLTGRIEELSDGLYLLTRFGTWYPLSYLSRTRP